MGDELVDGRIFYGLIAILIISIFPVMGQEPLIVIQTDDNNYDEGETIVISGDVSTVVAGEPITLQIFYEGNVVYIAQINVAKDGSFTQTVIAEGTFRNSGEYTVRAFYGGEISETFFDFTSKKGDQLITEIFEVDANDKGTFDVEYTIKGGIVKDIRVNSDNFSLEIEIESFDDGEINLDLNREAIDAKKPNGSDEEFIVLIDNVQVTYEENIQANSRLVTIEFQEGDNLIEVIGTFVIPEFGTIAFLILIAGITTIVVFSKSRLTILN